MIVEVFLVSRPLLISSRVSHQHLLRGIKNYILTVVKTIECYIKSVYFQISSYLDHKRKLQMKALQRSLKPDLWQSQKQKFNGSITRLSSRKRKTALLSSTKQICTCTAGRKKFPDELYHRYLTDIINSAICFNDELLSYFSVKFQYHPHFKCEEGRCWYI